MSKILILIPARYASTRFPGKPLAQMAGKSMIRWVYENMSKTSFDLAVVTDHPAIFKEVKAFGGQVLRVDDKLPCGTERIYWAYKRYFYSNNYELIINIQGDEPLLLAKNITSLASFHQNSSFDMATLLIKREKEDMWKSPDVVKAIYSDQSKECHYFSRSPIPAYNKNNSNFFWYQHIGVYSYKPRVLEQFIQTPRSTYEKIEKLEQLRALEIGLRIGALEIKNELIGVDRPEDILRVENVINQSNLNLRMD